MSTPELLRVRGPLSAVSVGRWTLDVLLSRLVK